MKIIAIIKNDRTQWDEEFTVTSKKTAKKEIKDVINYYNNTLRVGELKRFFVKLK